MADEKKNDRDWSTRVGTIKSVEEFKDKQGGDALRAIVVNAEGKESIVEGFGEKGVAKIREAEASDKPMVFRGPAYFTQGNVAHVMVMQVKVQGEPKAKAEKKELTEEEKAAKAEAARAAAVERDATRVPVIEGSVAEGETVSVNGSDVSVTSLGRAWELDTEEKVAQLQERFPDVAGLEVGAKVQFANFEAPENESSPSM